MGHWFRTSVCGVHLDASDMLSAVMTIPSVPSSLAEGRPLDLANPCFFQPECPTRDDLTIFTPLQPTQAWDGVTHRTFSERVFLSFFSLLILDFLASGFSFVPSYHYGQSVFSFISISGRLLHQERRDITNSLAATRASGTLLGWFFAFINVFLYFVGRARSRRLMSLARSRFL